MFGIVVAISWTPEAWTSPQTVSPYGLCYFFFIAILRAEQILEERETIDEVRSSLSYLTLILNRLLNDSLTFTHAHMQTQLLPHTHSLSASLPPSLFLFPFSPSSSLPSLPLFPPTLTFLARAGSDFPNVFFLYRDRLGLDPGATGCLRWMVVDRCFVLCAKERMGEARVGDCIIA